MPDITPNDQLWARLDAAHARGQARQAALVAEPGHSPTPGDVYLWPPPNDLGLGWIVVSDHPNNAALAYTIPADGHPLAGLADVVVRDAGREPLYLRCGRGRWVRRTDLQAERRYRVLDLHHVRRAQEKIRLIAAGPLDGSSSAWEDEADPDYHAWMAEVTEAVLGFADRGLQPVVLTDQDFIPWTSKRHREQTIERSLAAAVADPFAELIAPPGDLVVFASSLPFAGPGELRVIREPDGVAIVFEAKTAGESPVVAVTDATGRWQPLVWDTTPNRTAARATTPWIEGQVRLRIGTEEASREVIVPKP